MALEMKYAVKEMKLIGGLLVDNREMSFWERDTAILPKVWQRQRRKYRDFARRELHQCSLDVEKSLPDYDPWPLVLNAARQGFLTEFLTPPHGDFPVAGFQPSLSLAFSIRNARSLRKKSRRRRWSGGSIPKGRHKVSHKTAAR